MNLERQQQAVAAMLDPDLLLVPVPTFLSSSPRLPSSLMLLSASWQAT
jgi:hypothetical protein